MGERVRMRVRHSVRTCNAAAYTVYILCVMRDDASRSCFGDMRKSNLRNASGAVQQSSSGTVEEKSDFEERNWTPETVQRNAHLPSIVIRTLELQKGTARNLFVRSNVSATAATYIPSLVPKV